MTIDEIIKHYEQVLKELKAYKGQCDDAIGRQAAISAIMGEYPDAHYPSYYKNKIDELPSVTPQQRTGHWIINRDSIGRKYGECSECMMRQYVGTLNYCPNCGTKMEVEKSEDKE